VPEYNLEYRYRDHHATVVAPCIDERELANQIKGLISKIIKPFMLSHFSN